jgi:hypothetical protein
MRLVDTHLHDHELVAGDAGDRVRPAYAGPQPPGRLLQE